MSLDIYLEEEKTMMVNVFEANITHNLNKMAIAAGLYDFLWHPKENGIFFASDLIKPLKSGIKSMKINPKRYRKLDAKNGWGKYEEFLPWLEELLAACRENPNSSVSVWI